MFARATRTITRLGLVCELDSFGIVHRQAISMALHRCSFVAIDRRALERRSLRGQPEQVAIAKSLVRITRPEERPPAHNEASLWQGGDFGVGLGVLVGSLAEFRDWS